MESLYALERDDFEFFKEATAKKEEIEVSLEKAQAKYEATRALYEVERIAKEARDLDEIVQQELAEFESRSAAREAAYND